MPPSPYEPPKASVDDREADVRRGSTALAVLAGVVVDIVATEAGLLVYGIALEAPPILSLALAGGGMGGETISFVIGLAATALGGFTAAWVANRHEMWHGLFFGLATMAASELLLLLPPFAPDDPLPVWRQGLWYALAVPAALLGARMRKQRRMRAEPGPPVAQGGSPPT